jgi:hypothetical protein
MNVSPHEFCDVCLTDGLCGFMLGAGNTFYTRKERYQQGN